MVSNNSLRKARSLYPLRVRRVLSRQVWVDGRGLELGFAGFDARGVPVLVASGLDLKTCSGRFNDKLMITSRYAYHAVR